MYRWGSEEESGDYMLQTGSTWFFLALPCSLKGLIMVKVRRQRPLLLDVHTCHTLHFRLGSVFFFEQTSDN